MWHQNLMGRSAWATLFALSVVLAAVVVPGTTAQAQGGEVITYGTSVIGNITAEMPFAIYSLNMNAGDMMSVVVVGLAPDMLPAVGMVGADQRPIANSADDPFSAAGDRLARLDYRATQTGSYSLIVTNSNNTPGQFVLILDGRPTPAGTALSPDATETASLLPDSAPLIYTFQAPSTGNLLLSLNTTTPGFSFMARVYDGRGQLIARLAGVDLRGAGLDIGPGSGQYVVEVGALTSDLPGSVQISLAPGGAGVVAPGSPIPVATATPSVCQVTSSNRVNVRTGPSTAYPAFGALLPGSSLNVIGRNYAATWYVVNYSGQQGWVSGSVVEIGGPCDALPFVPDPPLPATPTPMPTATPAAPSVSFTSTIADGAIYPPGTCFTFFWHVQNVREVYFDGQGVSGQGQREACPTASRSYVLRVVYLDGTIQDFPIPVTISP